MTYPESPVDAEERVGMGHAEAEAAGCAAPVVDLPSCAWCAGKGTALKHTLTLPCDVCGGSRVLVPEDQQIRGISIATGWAAPRVRRFLEVFGQQWTTGAVRFAIEHGLSDPSQVHRDRRSGDFVVVPDASPAPAPATIPAPAPPAAACAVGQCDGSGMVRTARGADACACQAVEPLRARVVAAIVAAHATPGRPYGRAIQITIAVDAQPSAADLIGAANAATVHLNRTTEEGKTKP